jgi:4-hydroxybenzoate polyprenyltransferase
MEPICSSERREHHPVDAHQFVKGGQTMLSSVLWGVVALLVLLWLLGWLVGNAGSLIHLLLVLAVIVLLYNLFVAGRRRV